MHSLLRLCQHLVHNLRPRLGPSQLLLLVLALVAVGRLVEQALLVPSPPLVRPHRQPLVQHQAQPLVKALEDLVLQLLPLVKVEEVSFAFAAACKSSHSTVRSQKLLPVNRNMRTLLLAVSITDYNKTAGICGSRSVEHAY